MGENRDAGDSRAPARTSFLFFLAALAALAVQSLYSTLLERQGATRNIPPPYFYSSFLGVLASWRFNLVFDLFLFFLALLAALAVQKAVNGKSAIGNRNPLLKFILAVICFSFPLCPLCLRFCSSWRLGVLAVGQAIQTWGSPDCAAFRAGPVSCQPIATGLRPWLHEA